MLVLWRNLRVTVNTWNNRLSRSDQCFHTWSMVHARQMVPGNPLKPELSLLCVWTNNWLCPAYSFLWYVKTKTRKQKNNYPDMTIYQILRIGTPHVKALNRTWLFIKPHGQCGMEPTSREKQITSKYKLILPSTPISWNFVLCFKNFTEQNKKSKPSRQTTIGNRPMSVRISRLRLDDFFYTLFLRSLSSRRVINVTA